MGSDISSGRPASNRLFLYLVGFIWMMGMSAVFFFVSELHNGSIYVITAVLVVSQLIRSLIIFFAYDDTCSGGILYFAFI